MKTVQTIEDLKQKLDDAEYYMHKAYADVAGLFGVTRAEAKVIVDEAEAKFTAARDEYNAAIRKAGK